MEELTLISEPGDAENVAWGFFTSSSDEHSEHIKCSSFFASSIVMPTQAGWYLQETYKDWNLRFIKHLGKYTDIKTHSSIILGHSLDLTLFHDE